MQIANAVHTKWFANVCASAAAAAALETSSPTHFRRIGCVTVGHANADLSLCRKSNNEWIRQHISVQPQREQWTKWLNTAEPMDDWFLTNDFLMTEMDLWFRHFFHARLVSSRSEQPKQAPINYWWSPGIYSDGSVLNNMLQSNHISPFLFYIFISFRYQGSGCCT